MHGKHTPPQPDLERLVALCCMSAPFPAARSGVPRGQAPRGCIRRAERHQGLKPSICPGQRTRSRKGDKQEHRAGLLCSSAQALPVLKARGPLHPQPPSTRHEPQQKLPGPTLPSGPCTVARAMPKPDVCTAGSIRENPETGAHGGTCSWVRQGWKRKSRTTIAY